MCSNYENELRELHKDELFADTGPFVQPPAVAGLKTGTAT
jgi:hypothetical protein